MTRGKSIGFLAGAAVIPLTALAIGCGNNDGGGSATASTPPPSARSVTVQVANTNLGKVLVDSKGRTLYLFTKDSGSTSACSGMCATFWPPLQGKPKAGRGARASLLATIKRSGGQSQVTYHGHPLYRFAKDTKAGEVDGEGLTAFGGSWFAVSPAGNRVSPPSKAGAAAPAPSPSPRPAAPPAPAPTPPPAAPAPAPPPPPQASPPPDNGIPQNGGGDDDADNHGGPDDGDGGV